MGTGDHRLLNIYPVDKWFSDGSAVPVRLDVAKGVGFSDHHSAKVIEGGDGGVDIHHCPCKAPPHFGGVDADQPDPFASCRKTVVAVVAALDGHGLQSRGGGPKPPAASWPPVRSQWIEGASEQLTAILAVLSRHGADA